MLGLINNVAMLIRRIDCGGVWLLKKIDK